MNIEETEIDVPSQRALRRVERGTLRRYDEFFIADGGQAVADWVAQACSKLMASGHLASEPTTQRLELTASGVEASDKIRHRRA
ncbi:MULTISPECIES: hypothetical protein [unclassified Amycolatopsis]|uniref:hypothetical protein n=1 Tax=unclassified Amycolatopsis TaxID=2618356 RepID=UPI001C69B52B|nr:hypothetical protein [Amycolatopsis sp. DSM 110486]QYN20166.1 hypothetical protein K1T34_47785 [Amycolatopsis sp. DSM 110486]